MLHSIVISDGEDALKHVISRAAGKRQICLASQLLWIVMRSMDESNDGTNQVVIEDARGWWCGEAELL